MIFYCIWLDIVRVNRFSSFSRIEVRKSRQCLSHWLAQLDRERLALELVLKRLSRIEVDAMLQAIFAVPHPIPPELLETIYTLTEGNPFFVEEMLKSLITTGELQYADGKWEFRSEKREF